MTIFIDTAIVMYAAGGEHALRGACRRIIEGIRDGDIDATTSVEVIQEIGHRFVSIREPAMARRLMADTLDLFAPVLPISHAVVRRVPDLLDRYPHLQARDLVHVATCIHEGITDIVSPDRGFDQVAEVRRLEPVAFGA